MRKSFVVSLDVPEWGNEYDLIEYIEKAVACWKGSLPPEDPIFHLDGESVRVRRATAAEES